MLPGAISLSLAVSPKERKVTEVLVIRIVSLKFFLHLWVSAVVSAKTCLLQCVSTAWFLWVYSTMYWGYRHIHHFKEPTFCQVSYFSVLLDADQGNIYFLWSQKFCLHISGVWFMCFPNQIQKGNMIQSFLCKGCNARLNSRELKQWMAKAASLSQTSYSEWDQFSPSVVSCEKVARRSSCHPNNNVSYTHITIM